MDIIFYAASLRPGGGLTVAKLMIEALAENPSNKIIVFTGALDASLALQPTFETYDNVKEKQFFPALNSQIRYALSKVFFLPKSLFKRKALFISVNYYIPTFYTQFVYHLNLLSFLRNKHDGLAKKIKEFDAKLACKFANINVFESQYLKKTAEEYTAIKINNPKVLYIGVDPDFYISSEQADIKTVDKKPSSNLLLVSSMQPHKDNETCIKALAILVESNPNIPWVLNIAGGQTKDQWQPLLEFGDTLGVREKIRILGPLEKTKLSKIMKNSLCLMSASQVESFCMVALEAMASECPSIVTNTTSMPESVGDASILVNAGDHSSFAREIELLYNKPTYRNEFIKKGKKRSKAFSQDSFKKNLSIILENNIK